LAIVDDGREGSSHVSPVTVISLWGRKTV
jgi:hypothetical protein